MAVYKQNTAEVSSLQRPDIALVTHSRIDPTMKHSSVWKRLAEGFAEFFKRFPLLLYLIFSIIENYNDIEEYIGKVEEALKKNPRALVLPLTPKQGNLERKLLNLLKKYEGVIIAVNVPPDEIAMQELNGILRGYVGMNEVEAGRKAAIRLFYSGRKFECIYVPSDKPEHYGYSLRIKGIKEIAEIYGIPVCEVDITNAKRAKVICQLMGYSAFISLGPVGTSFAIEAQEKYHEKVCGIIAMDLDQKTAEAIKSQKVICTLIQHPREQGAKAAELAMKILNGTITSAFSEIYCGPTIVDLNNISVFE